MLTNAVDIANASTQVHWWMERASSEGLLQLDVGGVQVGGWVGTEVNKGDCAIKKDITTPLQTAVPPEIQKGINVATGSPLTAAQQSLGHAVLDVLQVRTDRIIAVSV